jgi:integrase
MAWVETKGTGFRVRHRHPDGTVETLARYGNKPEARRHAQRFNAGAPEQAPVPAHPHPVPPAPAAPVPVLAASAPGLAPVDTGIPVSTPTFSAVIPPPRRPAPRTFPISPPPSGSVAPMAPTTITLAQWVEIWIESHQIGPLTAAKYESHLRIHILPRFGATPLDQITRIEVKTWGKQMCERMATASAHSILTLLSTVMGEAADNRLITHNPCQGLRLAHGKREEKVIATPVQVLQLAERMDPAGATMVITAAYTGMRWGELSGLAWDNVKLDQEIPAIVIDPLEGALHELGGKLWLDAPKTENSVRTIALPPFLVAMLTAARTAGRYDMVFTGTRGALLRRSNFRQRVWDPAANGVPDHLTPARRAPITPGMTFHGLRHSHKTWMKEDGIDGFVQDKRLGHATPSIGDRYSHITPTMTSNLVDRLEARYQQSLHDFAALPKTPPGHSA